MNYAPRYPPPLFLPLAILRLAHRLTKQIVRSGWERFYSFSSTCDGAYSTFYAREPNSNKQLHLAARFPPPRPLFLFLVPVTFLQDSDVTFLVNNTFTPLSLPGLTTTCHATPRSSTDPRCWTCDCGFKIAFTSMQCADAGGPVAGPTNREAGRPRLCSRGCRGES